MKFTTHIITALLAILFINACTYRLDITTAEGAPHIIIYGHISTDTTYHYVHIHKSSGYFANHRPEGISNATVTISTDDTTFTLTEDSQNPGWYWTEGDVYGVEGKTYTMNIVTAEDNNEYEATSYLPYAIEMDFINIRDSYAFTDFLEIAVWGRIPEEDETYLSFHSFRNSTGINDSLSNFSLIDKKYIKDMELKGVPCMFLDQTEDQYKLYDGDNITLRIDILTKEYGTFLENAQMEVEGSIPIFTGPPANVRSNITVRDNSNSLPVLGFFSAYSTRYATTVYRREQ